MKTLIILDKIGTVGLQYAIVDADISRYNGLVLNKDSKLEKECVDFLKNLGFHNNSYIIGALLSPLYLNIRHLPESVLHSLRNMLQDKINQHPGYLLEDSYQNMLAYLNTPFEKNLKQSFAELSILDQRRGVNSRDIFKELYKLA